MTDRPTTTYEFTDREVWILKTALWNTQAGAHVAGLDETAAEFNQLSWKLAEGHEESLVAEHGGAGDGDA